MTTTLELSTVAELDSQACLFWNEYIKAEMDYKKNPCERTEKEFKAAEERLYEADNILWGVGNGIWTISNGKITFR